jgi:hypothetical protein
MERAKVSCTGPRTWPQLTPVDMTAPKVRTSKKFWHIQARALSTALAFAFPLRFSCRRLSSSNSSRVRFSANRRACAGLRMAFSFT